MTMFLVRRESLENFLDRMRIPYQPGPRGLVVPGVMDLSGSRIHTLPDNLAVGQHMILSGTKIQVLPRGLTVAGDLLMGNSHVRSLSSDLCVRGLILAAQGRLESLEPGIVILQDLLLMDAPIASLPEGLRIAGSLNVEGTRITRFPRDMRVQGLITPPHGLIDIRAFMQDVPTSITLTLDGSQHHRMEMQSRIMPFPDLWNVLCSMPEHHTLRIRRLHDGSLRTWIHKKAP